MLFLSHYSSYYDADICDMHVPPDEKSEEHNEWKMEKAATST